MLNYREMIQKRRGVIHNENSLLDIDSVQDNSCTELIAFMADTKTIGFRLGAEIATSLSHHSQRLLVNFMYTKVPVKIIRLELERLRDAEHIRNSQL